MSGHNRRATALFMPQAGIEDGAGSELSISLVTVEHTRNVEERDMAMNDAISPIEVDPETYEVRADGQLTTCDTPT